MRYSTGSDADALSEIVETQSLIVSTDVPNMLCMLQLAFRRNHIRSRNLRTPPELPALLARLGRVDHAIGLVDVICEKQDRAVALISLIKAIHPINRNRALQLVPAFVDLAKNTHWSDVSVRNLVTALLAVNEYGYAYNIAASLKWLPERVDALLDVACAVGVANEPVYRAAVSAALRSVDEARRADWDATSQRNKMIDCLLHIDEVAGLAEASKAEAIAFALPTRRDGGGTFHNPMPDSYPRAEALIGLATVLLHAGKVDEVARLRQQEGFSATPEFDASLALALARRDPSRGAEFRDSLIERSAVPSVPSWHARTLLNLLSTTALVEGAPGVERCCDRIGELLEGLDGWPAKLMLLAARALDPINQPKARSFRLYAEQMVMRSSSSHEYIALEGRPGPRIGGLQMLAVEYASLGDYVNSSRCLDLFSEDDWLNQGDRWRLEATVQIIERVGWYDRDCIAQFIDDALLTFARFDNTEWSHELSYLGRDFSVSRAFDRVVTALVVCGEYNEAEKAIRSCPNRERRSTDLVQLATSLIGIDAARSAKLADEVVATTRKLDRLGGKHRLLAEMAAALAITGEFENAVSIARLIQRDVRSVYLTISEKMLESGRLEECREALQLSLSNKSGNGYYFMRDHDDFRTCTLLASTGQCDEAMEFVKANEAARRSSYSSRDVANFGCRMKVSVIDALGKAGRFAEAETLAASVRSGSNRRDSWLAVLRNLCVANRWSDALRIARNRTELRHDINAIGLIAESFAASGQHELAEQLAVSIPSPYGQARVLARLLPVVATRERNAALRMAESIASGCTSVAKYDRVYASYPRLRSSGGRSMIFAA